LKLRLPIPGDYEGGFILFTLMIGITLVELYVVKKYSALAAERKLKSGGKENKNKQDSAGKKILCEAAGGTWKSDERRGCCAGARAGSGALPSNINRCETNVEAMTRKGCPLECLHDTNSAICRNNPNCVHQV
jgi:hypothetical protein